MIRAPPPRFTPSPATWPPTPASSPGPAAASRAAERASLWRQFCAQHQTPAAVVNLLAPDFYSSVWHHDLTKIALTAAGGWMSEREAGHVTGSFAAASGLAHERGGAGNQKRYHAMAPRSSAACSQSSRQAAAYARASTQSAAPLATASLAVALEIAGQIADALEGLIERNLESTNPNLVPQFRDARKGEGKARALPAGARLIALAPQAAQLDLLDTHERNATSLYFCHLDFRYLAIEGPPGSGKTLLAERLGTRIGASLGLELDGFDMGNVHLFDKATELAIR